jgi:glutaredoxin 3
MNAAIPVVMYTTRFCPYCIRARRLLDHRGVGYTDIPVDGDPARRRHMEVASGRHTVPQIWIGETHVGGFDELWRLEQQGQLDALLQAAPAT